jgi:hypothetical protein
MSSSVGHGFRISHHGLSAISLSVESSNGKVIIKERKKIPVAAFFKKEKRFPSSGSSSDQALDTNCAIIDYFLKRFDE